MENVLFKFALFFLVCAIAVKIVTFFSYVLKIKLRKVLPFCIHWAVISEVVGLGIEFKLSLFANIILGIATSVVCVFVFPPVGLLIRQWIFTRKTDRAIKEFIESEKKVK